MTGGGAEVVAVWVVVLCSVEITVAGTGAGLGWFGRAVGGAGWLCAVCCRLWERSPETVCETALLATVASVGITAAPPVLPLRPSSCWRNSASSPGGIRTGGEGTPPGRTVVWKPGRVTVSDPPAMLVTVRPLP